MKDLQVLREEIDQLDEQLWEVIGKRADVVRQIGEWKHSLACSESHLGVVARTSTL